MHMHYDFHKDDNSFESEQRKTNMKMRSWVPEANREW